MTPTGKVLRLALLACALSHLHGGTITRDIWDNAELVLRDFIATIETAIDGTLPQIDKLEAEITELSAQTLDRTDQVVSETLSRIDGAIDELRQQAEKEVVDVCVTRYISEINRLNTSVTQLVTNCVDNLETRALGQLNIARHDIRATLDVSYKLRQDIDGCYVADDSDECISRVIIEILLLNLEVTDQIGAILRRSEDIVGVYAEQVPVCLTDRIPNTNIIANMIIGSISACVHFG